MSEHENARQSLQEQQVIDYLLQHPDFFDFHPDLLKKMTLRHHAGTSSLLERQNKQFRQQLDEQERYFDNLVLHAKQNELLWARSRQVTLQCLNARNKVHLLEIAKNSISEQFKLPYVGFLLTQIDASPMAIAISPERGAEMLPDIFSQGRSAVGELTDQTAQFLCGSTTNICSFAVAPMFDEKRGVIGALVLGHDQANHFERSADTLFVDHLSALLAILLLKLDKPFSTLSNE